MGRRKGSAVAQGSTRAASSSSAKELLSRQGFQTGFIGFSGSRVTATSTPQLDGDLQMAFKRIGKKDVTTKLKAFASLLELAQEKDVATLTPCLQTWVHEVFVAKLGKAIAPELKKMAGAWILLMHDPHRDCRDAALKAFSAAFPPEKHSATWLFCKAQIMATIEDRLKQQPETLSDMRRVNPTEAKDVWIRNLTCAMAAACQLLGLMDAATKEKLAEKWTSLFSADFWKLFSHKIPALRRQAYVTLGHIIKEAPFLVEARMDKTAGNVLTMLREQDTQCVIAMVPTATAFFASFPKGTAGVKDQQLHQARGYLMKLLEAAAFGSAPTTYPDMLNLLNLLPKMVQGEEEKFFASVSDKVWQGISSKYAQALDTRKASLSLYCQVLNRRAALERDDKDVEKATEALIASTMLPCEDFLGPNPRFPATFFFEAYCSLLAALHASARPVFDAVVCRMSDLALASLEDESRSATQHKAVATFAVALFERTKSASLAARMVDAALEKGEVATAPALGLLMALATLLRTSGPASELVAYGDEEIMRNFVLPWIRQGGLQGDCLLWVCHTARCRFVAKASDGSETSRLGEVAVVEDWKALVEAVQGSAEDRCAATLCLLRAICEPVHKNSALHCDQLDDVAKMTVSGMPCDTADKKELLVLLLTGASHTSDPLLPPDAVSTVMEALRSFLLSYVAQEPTEPNFSLPAMQAVLRVLSVIDAVLASSYYTAAAIKEQEECFLVLFRLRVCVKYYWKQLVVDRQSGCLTTDSSLSHGLVETKVSSQVSRSPVASLASSIWEDRFPSFVQDLKDDEGEGSVQRLSSSLTSLVHQAVRETPSAWFDAALYAHMATAVLAVAGGSDRDAIIKGLLFAEDDWVSARRSLSLVSFVDLNKEPISMGQVALSAASDRSCLYPRLLRFSLSLLDQVGMEDCLGHGQERRAWLLRELIVAKVLARDAIMPPVGHGSDADDEWSIAFELLGDYAEAVDEPMVQLSVLPDAAEELTQQVEDMIACLARGCQHSDAYVDVYALALLVHKVVSGDEERAAWAWGRLVQPLVQSLLSEGREGRAVCSAKHTLWLVEAMGPEVVAAINPLSLGDLGIQKMQQAAIEALFVATSPEALAAVASTLATLIHTPRLSTPDASSGITELLMSVLMQLQTVSADSVACRTAVCRLLAVIAQRVDAKTVVADQMDFVFTFCEESLQQCQWGSVGSERLLREAVLLFKAACGLSNGEENEEATCRCLHSLFALLVDCGKVDVRQPTVSLLLLPLCHAVTRGLTRRPELIGSLVASHLDRLYDLLAFPHVEIQKAACLLLSAHLLAAPGLVGSAISVGEEEEDGVLCLLPVQLRKILEEDVSAPGAEEEEEEDLAYVYRTHLQKSVRSMLAWCLVKDFFGKQEMKVRRILASWFRRSGTIFRFLSLLFDRIMLANPNEDPQPSQDVAVAALDPTYPQSLERFMAEMYLSMLGTLPSLVRSWWNDCCGRVRAQEVLQFTAKFISPVLCAREVMRCAELEEDLDDFEISGNVRASEVTAVYTQDDAELSMTLHLPQAFPLQSVEVTCGKSLVMKAPERKRWTLTLHRILMTQDASILDAVLLWRDNMEKKFEGVESCLICYSVFHDSNSSLPNLTCKTCSNKFHSACLYKWFNTSHKSNCPLCQTPWIE